VEITFSARRAPGRASIANKKQATPNRDVLAATAGDSPTDLALASDSFEFVAPLITASSFAAFHSDAQTT
jgi:hypothetical protein